MSDDQRSSHPPPAQRVREPESGPVVAPNVTKGPLVLPDACWTCGSRGTILEGGAYKMGQWGQYIGGTERACPRCSARTALAMLLVRIGSHGEARWDQHVRDVYGDEVADELAALLKDARIPVAEYANARVSERGVRGRGAP